MNVGVKITRRYYGFNALKFLIPCLFLIGFFPILIINKKIVLIISFSCITFIFVFFTLIRLIVYFIVLKVAGSVDSKKYDNMQLKGVIGDSGAPRTGKSLDAVDTIMNHRLGTEDYVNYRYSYLLSLQLERELTKSEKEDLEEITKALDFYKAHPNLIPFVASNVIWFDEFDRKPLQLTAKHLLQIDRLPPYCDVLIDESSSIIGIDLYKVRPIVIDEFARFPGHFLGDRVLIILCEQDANASYIAFRRSFRFYRHHDGVIEILKPKRLFDKLEKIKNEFMEYQPGTAPRDLFRKLHKIDRLYKSIGFLKLPHEKKSGPESGSKSLGEFVEYMSCVPDFKYSNRVFKKWLNCYDDKIVYSSFPDYTEFLDHEQKKEIINVENGEITCAVLDEEAEQEKKKELEEIVMLVKKFYSSKEQKQLFKEFEERVKVEKKCLEDIRFLDFLRSQNKTFNNQSALLCSKGVHAPTQRGRLAGPKKIKAGRLQ